ncbi:MAG: TIR domain-containing protein [Chitinophagaceae bacterium]|nr:TIR domain-containing protein [Chitinophagaceae bacterium]
MNFEKDVFISYAHVDDVPITEGMKGWISELHEYLQNRVFQLTGVKPVIWRDARLQGNDFFAPEIVAQFPKLKVLVSIITPRYLKSAWCTKEVEEFFKAANENGGIEVENKARIFKIIKTPVNRNEQPEKIREILGYEFYKVDSASGKFTEFDKMYGQELQQAYYAKANDVAQDIAKLIMALDHVDSPNGNGNGKAPANAITYDPTKVSSGKKIYLADTSYDQKEYHENVKRELEDTGFTVFPNKNLTPVADLMKGEVEDFMKDCSLSLHIIGSSYGLVPEGTDKSIIALQNEIAAKQSAEKGLNRLIWIPPNVTTEDARQLAFIDQLRHQEVLQSGSDLLEGTIEEFKFAIFDTIRKQEAKEKAEKEKALEDARKKALDEEKKNQTSAGVIPTATPAVDAGPRMVYFVCDQRDLSDTKPIEDFLFDSGYEVILPIFEGEEADLRKEHEENLRTCDAILVYYGNANELWLRSMTRDLLRLPALGRTQPLLASIAYLAPPSSTQKERFRSHELTVVNGLAGFNPEILNDFKAKLK